MGWEDREYSQSKPWRDPAYLGGVRLPTGAARILIILHLAAYVLVLLLRESSPEITSFLSGMSSQYASSPIAILLHPFTVSPVHALGGALRILSVLLIIWILGGLIEERCGARRMLMLYAFGNLLAGAAYFPLMQQGPRWATAPLDEPLGAFAAWALVAYRQMKFEYVPFFSKLYSISTVVAIWVGVVIGLEFLLAWQFGLTFWVVAGAVGASSAFFVPRLEAIGRGRGRRRRGAVRPSIRESDVGPLREPAIPDEMSANEPDIDDILAKISREGMGSLTAAERERLEEARRAKLSRR